MKNSIIVLALLFSIHSIEAQTNELNQVELIKQFVGKWECDAGRKTTYYCDNKPFGNGLDCAIQVVADGEIIDSVKQLIGYNSKSDRYEYIQIEKMSSLNEFNSLKFLTEHTGVILPLETSDSNVKMKFNFEIPDRVKFIANLEHDIVVEMVYNRIKNQ